MMPRAAKTAIGKPPDGVSSTLSHPDSKVMIPEQFIKRAGVPVSRGVNPVAVESQVLIFVATVKGSECRMFAS